MKKNIKIGIIAEDESDVSSISCIINRIVNKKIGTERFVGKGCGKIKRKSNSWAGTLKIKGCNILIIIHDSDTSDEQKVNILKREIVDSLQPCPIEKNLIVIPIQELEAWFLSDPNGIRNALNLKKTPKIDKNPEFIDSPKEFLEKLIFKTSNGEKYYINTRHNEIISQKISLESIRKKCKTFVQFSDFILSEVKI